MAYYVIVIIILVKCHKVQLRYDQYSCGLKDRIGGSLVHIAVYHVPTTGPKMTSVCYLISKWMYILFKKN